MGIDWDAQLVGDGVPLPPLPLVISVGDALVVEIPTADDSGEYRYVASIFMDGLDVLSKPVDETIEVKVKKKKKAGGPAPDPLNQLSFVGLQEGKCVLFVDLSWEDQEEKLTGEKQLQVPVMENTVGRIGPLEIE